MTEVSKLIWNVFERLIFYAKNRVTLANLLKVLTHMQAVFVNYCSFPDVKAKMAPDIPKTGRFHRHVCNAIQKLDILIMR